MPRGRPKKIVEEPVEFGSFKDIIADTLHKWCSVTGCGIKLHYAEADDIIAKLAEAGFLILNGDEE